MFAIFIKSDACAEAHPGEPDRAEVVIERDAQVTYGHLLRHGDDLTLATMSDEGCWMRPNGTHWSDVIFVEGLPARPTPPPWED